MGELAAVGKEDFCHTLNKSCCRAVWRLQIVVLVIFHGFVEMRKELFFDSRDFNSLMAGFGTFNFFARTAEVVEKLWSKVLDSNIQLCVSESMHMLDLDRAPTHVDWV